MGMCYRCNLPAFDGAASYVGPQCRCWARYAPTDEQRRANECRPAKPLTEEDVRRIVREELARKSAPAAGTDWRNGLPAGDVLGAA
jgi:hypothetical protein